MFFDHVPFENAISEEGREDEAVQAMKAAALHRSRARVA